MQPTDGDLKHSVLGAVLAGGRSRRFGADKALADLEGSSLIEHAIRSLSGHVGDIVICGREMEGITCLLDRPAPDLGPLGGLNAALHHAASYGYAGVLTTGCDTPFLEPGLPKRLTRNGAAVVAGYHLVGYWPSALAAVLDTHLTQVADRSIRGWLQRVAPAVIALDGDPLANINTQTDLAKIQGNRARRG